MTDIPCEDSLMRQAANGDRASMERLYKEVSTPIYNYLLRLSGDPEQSRDALQTTFMNAWQSRATFRGQGARAWLFVIARNAAIRLHRHSRTPELVPAEGNVNTPVEDQEAAELAERLDAALERLSADTREAIVLSRVSGLNLDEIAALLGTSNGALRVRLSRGLNRLKEELEK